MPSVDVSSTVGDGVLKALSLEPVGITTAMQHRYQPVPEDLPRECDLVFTTPSHQAPTNATMPLECLRVLLGHSNLEITRRYARLSDKTREEEYFTAMDRILKGARDENDQCDR